MAQGRSLVRDALAGLQTARVPFVPLVETFAAVHLQVPVRDFYSSPGVLVRGLDMARRLTGADGIVCLPDPTLLAEACGCPLSWAADGPRLQAPSAGAALALEPEEVLQRGRVGVVLDALQRLRHGVGQQWAILGSIQGPYSLACQLWPGDLALALAAGEESARELLESAGAVCVQLAHRLGALELDGCLVMDGSHVPGAGAAPVAAPIYETIANVLAFYACPAVYQADAVDWLSRQGLPCFEIVLPGREGPADASRVSGGWRSCALVPEALLLGRPEDVKEAVAALLRDGPVMLSTAGAIPPDAVLPALRMVATALGA